MPIFYIHLKGPDTVPDLVGQELEDVQAAKCAAIHMVAKTLCSQPQAFWDAEFHQVRVSDEWGLTLFVVDIQTTTSPSSRLSGRAPPSEA